MIGGYIRAAIPTPMAHCRWSVITPAFPAAGAVGFAAFILGMLPVLIGFLIPSAYLLAEAVGRVTEAGISPELIAEIRNTVLAAAIATVLAVVVGFAMGWIGRAR